MLPYSKVDDIYLSHHPWNREVHSRPSVRGFFKVKIGRIEIFYYFSISFNSGLGYELFELAM